jgi:hypothetical protein
LRILVFGLVLLARIPGSAQTRVGIATDILVLRNFSPQQKFWSIGQSLQGIFHFSSKESAYVSLTYSVSGKFKNEVTTTSRAPVPEPDLHYTVHSNWRFRELSLGWRHYFKGAFDQEQTWNFYGTAGFGLMFTKVQNDYDPRFDTSSYNLIPPLEGLKTLRALTFDLGLGIEYPLGANFFAYGGIGAWLPASHDPSPYVYDKNLPRPVTMHAGLRIVFGD